MRRSLLCAVSPLIPQWSRAVPSSTAVRFSGTVVQEYTSQSTVESNQAKSSAAVMRETHVTEMFKVTDEQFAFVNQSERSNAHCHVRCDDERR